tara:strand:- start:262 stop:1428 length:1167 start_codon:yes stop_codon:yes gene_type:complete
MSPFLGTTGGGSSLGFRRIGAGSVPGMDQSNPATSAKAIKDAGGTTNGFYWIKPTGYSGSAYPVYCILNGGTSNKHFGGGWTLAMSFKHGTNRPWHLGQSWGSRNTHAYYSSSNWNSFWTGASVEASTNGKPYSFQDRGEWTGNQDFSKDGRAIGMWQPMKDLMIMYHDSDQSFNDPGASAWWTKNGSLSTQSLRDWWNGGEQVWSTGGRQGMFDRGTLNPPVYNPDRGQAWTGDPVFMNNAVGQYTQSLSGYDLVFNVSSQSSAYRPGGANHNKSRITNTGMNDSVTGNDYQHTQNWGFGQYHYEGGWNGGALHCLGPASYCDCRMQHFPGGGTADADISTGVSDNAQAGGGSYAFWSSCRNTGTTNGVSNSSANTSHYGFSLWVRE